MVRTLLEFCEQFGLPPPPHVSIGRRRFYDPHHLLALAQSSGWEAFSVGLYLGEEKTQFQATSALVELLGKQSDRRVVVNDRAAWLFLCNRDILMEGVQWTGEFAHDTRVFVIDRDSNVLGCGRIVGHYDKKMKNKTYVKHLLDKGEYLRRER